MNLASVLRGAVTAGAICLAFGQTSESERAAIVANPNSVKWVHEARDPEGAESVVLRADPKTGSLELFARYPAGHVFPPHWHDPNERIVLLEGRLSMQKGQVQTYLEAGGFAFLPAKEVQRLACVSDTRCTFYIYWDGDPRSRKPPVN